jgi:hypothetical protein
MREKIKRGLEMFQRLDVEYALLCDDDFTPIPNFFQELQQTIALLPSDWRCLHLCPGYVWGRQHRDTLQKGQFIPQWDMTGIPYHASGRFFHHCNASQYYQKKFWMGGPVALLLRKNEVDDFLHEFISSYEKDPMPDDVIFTLMMTERDFVCRQPVLGYEDEGGGSTFR